MIGMIDIPTTSYQLFNQLLIVENFSARISTPVNPFYKFVLVSVSQKVRSQQLRILQAVLASQKFFIWIWIE